MTQEEIIQLACEVFGGIIKKEERHNFIAFAKLVAEAAASKEREACAKLCEKFTPTDVNGFCSMAEIIRARGNEECCGNPFKCEGNCVEHCADKVQP